MKKLLLILLCLPLLFTTCKKEDEEPNSTGFTKEIGQGHQGGVIFWLDGNGGGLILSVQDQAIAEWGCAGSLLGVNGTAIGTGAQNTIDIVAGCATPGTAAYICDTLTLNGYSDWFLPSKDELNKMYLNYHVPGIQVNMSSGWYWSSTEYSYWNGVSMVDKAWQQRFQNGTQDNGDKWNPMYVRAIRAF